MMLPNRIIIITCCVGTVAVIGAGLAGIGRQYWERPAAITPAVLLVPPPIIHTAGWYLAHRDVLKIDEQRCQADAASIEPAACTNVADAVSEIDNSNFQALLQQGANAKK